MDTPSRLPDPVPMPLFSSDLSKLSGTKPMWNHHHQKWLRFSDRHTMRRGHPLRRFHTPFAAVTPSLPIDWAKNLVFPMYGNDQYGDCMYAAGCHGDQTFTGNTGVESSFDLTTIVKNYLALSGGDNGLDEGMLTGEWKRGLASNPLANILDVLDLDPTNIAHMQSAIGNFGGVVFMLSCPDVWISDSAPGYTWDIPAKADPNNGHGVWLNGMSSSGKYQVQSWGMGMWLTPAGVKVCDPSAFVVFSLRWFNAQGFAPNGKHYTELAPLWMASGGHTLPPSPFPPPPVPVPIPEPLPPIPPKPIPGPIVPPIPPVTPPVDPPLPPGPEPIPVPIPTPAPGQWTLQEIIQLLIAWLKQEEMGNHPRRR